MIYAARSFERSRRDFLFEISVDFLDLVLEKRRLNNSEESVRSFELSENRERARYEEGFVDRFEAARAENATVSARASLNTSRERYRSSVDRFKVRLGMPVDQALTIVDSGLELPMPLTSLVDAVRTAMTYRLDLQTDRDQLADTKRQLDNARNDLLPDLDFDASVNIPTDPDKDRAGVDFEPRETDFTAGITFGLPLDREVERLNVRQSQINLERARRSYDESRDNVATEVRQAVRSIDAALFNVQIQTRGMEIAEQRIDSIQAAPERANAIERTDAVTDRLNAQDDFDQANRDLQVSILRYLLDSGQLRINEDGYIQPLEGMDLTRSTPDSDSPGPDDPNDTSGG